jgi:hypothetical protein
VHSRARFRPFGLTLNEKQIPQIVENNRNQSRKWHRWNESLCAQGRCATRLRYAPTVFNSLPAMPFKFADLWGLMLFQQLLQEREYISDVTARTAANAAPKDRYGASRRNAVKTSSALVSDAPPRGQRPSRYAPSLTQRLIQISSQHRKRHQDSRQHSLRTENIALRVEPKPVHLVEPDIECRSAGSITSVEFLPGGFSA